MSAIGVGVSAAFVAAGGLGGAAFGAVAAGEQEGGGADEQGEDLDVFHAFYFWWFSCAGALPLLEGAAGVAMDFTLLRAIVYTITDPASRVLPGKVNDCYGF